MLLLLPFAAVSLTACDATYAVKAEEHITVGQMWRAEEFKDISPTDVRVAVLDRKRHTVTFVLDNQYDIENIRDFRHDYRRLTHFDGNIVLQRRHTKETVDEIVKR
ncbi:MAG TPA: hypothetical protein VK559_00905 [Ferruginibacter sp.]|nr:hypothetical protein [Ferruginibacter sp.]